LPRDLICFSHLRWDFVYQRPHHLMARFARTQQVFFVEEPIACGHERPALLARQVSDRLSVIVPTIPEGSTFADHAELQAAMLAQFLAQHGCEDPVLWYYTPLALACSRDLAGSLVVDDCMDELASFRGAPPNLAAHERDMFARADVVFTGGPSLFAAKRQRHQNVYCIPSAVDVAHFAGATASLIEPDDQRDIPSPRIGYCGVIDERMDYALLAAIADTRPAWHLVMLGPVVKVDAGALPRRPNIHYLGLKRYAELPAYLAGWDVAMLPFARDESTRWISPTKTPEYLAAGKPVVSTPIADVAATTYARAGYVTIARDPHAFVTAIEQALRRPTIDDPRLRALLDRASWDRTWRRMNDLMAEASVHRRQHADASVL
jgi:UDP-galactopyranose mutase